MYIIVDIDQKTFSLNGIKYLKNYLSRPYGDRLEIFNAYERKDVLVEQADYDLFTVDGAVFSSVTELQEVLLEVLYYRNSLSEGGGGTGVKPTKNVTTSTTGYSGGTYTLQTGDDKKWLIFNIATNYNIRVPNGVFTVDAEFEGETIGNGQATFTVASGVTLHYGASKLPKTAEKESAFGMKFRTNTDVSVFGQLELA